ncbi:MAG TPA: catalase [Thermoanaerobaculia bacterium]|nr:catalase [Thermoanaerobaculia bacterium]
MSQGKKKPKASKQVAPEDNKKVQDLEVAREDGSGQYLSTNHGTLINDNQNSLKAGERGPSLLEDFILREKITHFDHERIPERIVHARGSAAHGFFQVYESQARITRAGFLQDPSVRTPVFVRFSTVAGSRGSSDLARDVRGFSVKFYTEEGNYDLVGNNIPVFFIQDAVKFPDLIHAVKPEPNSEMPQAASAHDTFWDFISLMPESMHMIMWVMSDRAIPRSLRMMEGFGVHTFRFINEQGKARFVKFHWKPLLGVHSVVWDEAQKISGKDPDFHRRDLWEAIETGAFPEWELGVQIIEEEDEFKYGFDLLDPTKLIPEELVPVQRIGKMTLNRNPDNFFSETEQVAFHPGHIVSGIDFTNDPLLQGRLFSYTDTQLSRLGSPNFHEIPINRPVVGVHNNQRDGHMRQTINVGRVSYEPNTLGGGCPMQAGQAMGGFVSHAEKIDSVKIRGRSESFFDHFSQATLFFNSQSDPEKAHIIKALRFELGKVEVPAIRERMVGLLAEVDATLAAQVAEGLGIKVPKKLDKPINMSIPADGDVAAHQPRRSAETVKSSAALSMAKTVKDTIKSRKIAVLAADGFDEEALSSMKQALTAAGAVAKIVAPRGGTLKGANGKALKVDFSLLTTSSVLFDAVYIPGGAESVAALTGEADAIHFVNEAYKHCKAIAAVGEGIGLLEASAVGVRKSPGKKGRGAGSAAAEGVIVGSDTRSGAVADQFIAAIAAHRHWSREQKPQVPA